MSLKFSQRIVVTGIGVVSPLGCGSEITWQRLINNQSGVKYLPKELSGDLEVKIAAQVPSITEDPHGFDVDSIIEKKFQCKMDRFIHFGLEAARQALTQAQWTDLNHEQQHRTATIIGSSIGGINTISNAVQQCMNKGPQRLSPATIPSFLINMIAGQISIRFGLKGPTGAPSTACTASTQAIGDGIRMLLTGEVDVALCGGAESCVERMILSSFVSSGAVVTKFNETPEKASRPFSIDRSGFVLGEGAAILVIETLEHAIGRGAKPIAEIIGYSACSEAYHPTACKEYGDGLQTAMRGALKSAKLDPKDIGYINAHGTSTPLGDKSEFFAIREVFGLCDNVSVSSTKSSVGHLLGAAGSIETVFTILSLRDGVLPPNLNLEFPDPLFTGLDLVGAKSKRKTIEYAMTNSAGFGGVNASLVLKRWA